MSVTRSTLLPVRRLKAKICVVGGRAVGKTSLIARFVLDASFKERVPTAGTEVSKKSVPVRWRGRPVMMDLTIWDISGENGFRELLKEAYFYGAKGVIAVTTIGQPDELDEWLEATYSVTGRIPVQFVSNKWDLSREDVDYELIEKAAEYDSPYFLTSTKSGENVEAVFENLAQRIADEVRGGAENAWFTWMQQTRNRADGRGR